MKECQMKKRYGVVILVLAIVMTIGALLFISLSPRFHLEEELAILKTRIGQFSAQWPGDTFSIWYWDGEHNVRLWPPGWK